jgi:hypothetical protein
MNSKGTKRNLKASQPGNSNAQKTGLYSERERAERARKVRQDLERDPRAALDNGLRDRYSQLRAISELFHDHLIEHGVSDRHGKQRRQAGSYLRTLSVLGGLEEQIQRGLATAAIEDDDTQLWDPSAIKRRLQAIADDPSLPGGARVKALEDLLRESGLAEEVPYDEEFFRELHSMTDEELDRELQALMIPITTGRGRDKRTLEHPRKLIQEFASQDRVTDNDLADLRDSLTALFNPFPHSRPMV